MTFVCISSVVSSILAHLFTCLLAILVGFFFPLSQGTIVYSVLSFSFKTAYLLHTCASVHIYIVSENKAQKS